MLWFHPTQDFRQVTEKFSRFKVIKPRVAERMHGRDGVTIILKDEMWATLKKKNKFNSGMGENTK